MKKLQHENCLVVDIFIQPNKHIILRQIEITSTRISQSKTLALGFYNHMIFVYRSPFLCHAAEKVE
jgi:hypothetical protein